MTRGGCGQALLDLSERGSLSRQERYRGSRPGHLSSPCIRASRVPHCIQPSHGAGDCMESCLMVNTLADERACAGSMVALKMRAASRNASHFDSARHACCTTHHTAVALKGLFKRATPTFSKTSRASGRGVSPPARSRAAVPCRPRSKRGCAPRAPHRKPHATQRTSRRVFST